MNIDLLTKIIQHIKTPDSRMPEFNMGEYAQYQRQYLYNTPPDVIPSNVCQTLACIAGLAVFIDNETTFFEYLKTAHYRGFAADAQKILDLTPSQANWLFDAEWRYAPRFDNEVILLEDIPNDVAAESILHLMNNPQTYAENDFNPSFYQKNFKILKFAKT